MKKNREIKTSRSPLISWDISNSKYAVVTGKLLELQTLTNLSQLNNWEIDIRQVLSEGYQTLVLTNTSKEIIWVNEGFRTMTGYSPSFALGKNPSFLQGVNTNQKTSDTIRRKLLSGRRFTETITNYRRNGEEYECHISVIPLRNNRNIITHFLALESESA